MPDVPSDPPKKSLPFKLGLGCLLPALVCGGCLAVGSFGIYRELNAMRDHPAYRDAIDAAAASRRVTDVTGTPIQGGLPMGQFGDDVVRVDFGFDVTGPDGSASIRVAGSDRAGDWVYDRMTAALGTETIDLLSDDADGNKTADRPSKTASASVTATFYSVGQYDADRDPGEDLNVTLARAKSESKRVIIQVGGDWCPWCKLLSNELETNPKLSQTLDDHFVVMKLATGDAADEFLKDYPDIPAYPHWFVIESDGSLVESINPEPWEDGRGYDGDQVLAYLGKVTPD